jgi:hypothetical protein
VNRPVLTRAGFEYVDEQDRSGSRPPSSPATSRIERPLALTKLTASRRNSGGYAADTSVAQRSSFITERPTGALATDSTAPNPSNSTKVASGGALHKRRCSSDASGQGATEEKRAWLAAVRVPTTLRVAVVSLPGCQVTVNEQLLFGPRMIAIRLLWKGRSWTMSADTRAASVEGRPRVGEAGVPRPGARVVLPRGAR